MPSTRPTLPPRGPELRPPMPHPPAPRPPMPMPRPYWGNDWYSHHPTAWHWHGPNRVWWSRPVWGECWGWFAAGFFTSTVVNHIVEPVPYNYGNNVYYRNGMVYVNGVPYVSAEEYYRQAQALAMAGQAPPQQIDVNVNVNNAPANDAANSAAPPNDKDVAVKTLDETQWLPLGTFAILKNPEDQKFQRMIQIATSKDGKVRGQVIDVDNDDFYTLFGAVDPKTQRVAMSSAEYPNTAIECGLWNLTQDTLTVLIHRSATVTEERTLVRLVEPDAADASEKNPSKEPQLNF
ncbi:MAG: hypothetical protein ACRC46_00035 [Thermoguttaceae bacterium]